MANQTLALIAAAGYGTRMGDASVPKVMLPDKDDRPFIEDAFTFFDTAHGIDFAVLTRNEGRFEPLQRYLAGHEKNDQFSVLYQTMKPFGLHVLAILCEYWKKGPFFDHVKNYRDVVVLPGDNKLTITIVFSGGWNNEKAYKDYLVQSETGRIQAYGREKRNAIEPRKGIGVTTTGVWVLNEKVLNNKPHTLMSALGILGIPLFSRYGNAYSYFISAGWGGVRDTPDTIGK